MLIKSPLCLAMIVALGLPVAAHGQQFTLEQQANEQQQNDEQQNNEQQNNEQQQADQQRRTAGFRGAGQPGAQDAQARGQHKELVNYLAGKLLLSSQCQVELAKLGAQQAQHSQVKDFARQLSSDHEQLAQQLKRQMPGLANVESPFSSARSQTESQQGQQGQPGTTRRDIDESSLLRGQERSAQERAGQLSQRADRAGAQQRPGQSGEFLDGDAQTLMDITRRAAESNHEAVTQMLREKQGDQFDKCFVNAQIGAHMWLSAELKAMRDVGPQEFTSVVQEAERTVERHLQTAKQLASTLENEGQAASGQGAADRLNRPQR